jgi:RNA polymerase sigma-70 factor (ECF subfamily)
MNTPWEIDLTIYHTEQELVQGLRHREPMSCTCLFKQFEPRLIHLALQLAKESTEAEDIVQESFIRACASITDFRAQSTLGTWLHRIVLNTALMYQRRKQPPLLPLEAVNDELFVQQLPLAVGAGRDPVEMVLLKEQQTRLQQAIGALPETLRNVFFLRAVEGFSTREAATLLGISETALKVRFHRARLALQDSLASEI